MKAIEYLKKKAGRLSKREEALIRKILGHIEVSQVPYGDSVLGNEFLGILEYFLEEPLGLGKDDLARFCYNEDGHITVAEITKDDVLKGLGDRDEDGHLKNTGVIRIIDSPNGDGPVVMIGKEWFYIPLGTRDYPSFPENMELDSGWMPADEFLKAADAGDIAESVFAMLSDLAASRETVEEYVYCYFVLKKRPRDFLSESTAWIPAGIIKIDCRPDGTCTGGKNDK